MSSSSPAFSSTTSQSAGPAGSTTTEEAAENSNGAHTRHTQAVPDASYPFSNCQQHSLLLNPPSRHVQHVDHVAGVIWYRRCRRSMCLPLCAQAAERAACKLQLRLLCLLCKTASPAARSGSSSTDTSAPAGSCRAAASPAAISIVPAALEQAPAQAT